MRVHDLRPNVPKSSNQPAVAGEIAQRMQAAAHLRDEAQIESLPLRPLDQAPFGSQPRPADEADFVAVKLMLVLDRQQRVLLSSADDQPRNDVRDAKLHRRDSPSSTACGSAGRETGGRASY